MQNIHQQRFCLETDALHQGAEKLGTEIMGPGVAYECSAQNGMHVNEDHFIVEVIDPDTGEVLPEGAQGEIVFSCIIHKAFPLLRYRTRDFGILRIIVGDSERTEKALRDAGFVVKITPVLAVAIADRPGSLSPILKLLAGEHISLEYIYAFTTRHRDCAYMIFRVADNDRAIQVLTTNGVRLLAQEELDQQIN